MPAGAAAAIAARTRTARYNAELEAAVHARTAELAETQLEIVVRLAQAAELRDDDTGDHIERMSGLCREVALELGMSAAEADLVRHASVLHDIGKIGVPDGILLKPGRLTDEELTIMRRHVLDGARLLTGSDSALLQAAEVIVRTHHERWDGTGYPLGLAGEEIPLAGPDRCRLRRLRRARQRAPVQARLDRGRRLRGDRARARRPLRPARRRRAARGDRAPHSARDAPGQLGQHRAQRVDVAALILFEVPQQLG